MSHWKTFHSTSSKSNLHSPSKEKKSTKYNPARDKSLEASHLKFKNATLSQIHDSLASINQDQSATKRSVKGSLVVNSAKYCNSQLALRKMKTEHDVQTQSKINPAHLNQILNTPTHSFHASPPSNNNQTKVNAQLSYQRQIDRIKKQFKDFQTLIIGELRRQQLILNTMVQKIVEQLRDGLQQIQQAANINETSEWSQMQAYRVETPPPVKMQKKPIISKIEQSQEKKSEGEKSDHTRQGKSKQKLSLNRFFDAMNMLKRDVKDIWSLGHVENIKSPKNNRSWRETLEKLKKKK